MPPHLWGILWQSANDEIYLDSSVDEWCVENDVPYTLALELVGMGPIEGIIWFETELDLIKFKLRWV